MANRSLRAQIAQETINILHQGYYTLADGNTVSIIDPLEKAISNTKLYFPQDFATILPERDRLCADKRNQYRTEYIVENCTTFAAAQRIWNDYAVDAYCLNFASAKSPGGGFLQGSQAQEECLARASGLYACINPVTDYYENNRACGTALYTDHMIYSPKVPVFRDDNDDFLQEYYPATILTAPAVNAGAVRNNEPENVTHIKPVMIGRMEKVLSLAVIHNHEYLVLGAWGCGVFQNNPLEIAQWFFNHLEGDLFKGNFRKVIFAIWDNTKEQNIIGPFYDQFGLN